MKKVFVVCLLVCLLLGCTSPSYETVMDTMPLILHNAPKEIKLQLPPGTVQPVFENKNTDKLYFCDGYEMILRTVEGGDLQKTVKDISGYDIDDLTVVETKQQELKRYEFVWTAAGENGDRVGRTAVLDDGIYHYTLSLVADAQLAGQLRQTWEDIISTFAVVSIA